MSSRRGERTATVDDLRRQLHEALTSEAWGDAAELQQTILMRLDRMSRCVVRNSEARREMFERGVERIEELSGRVQRRGKEILVD